jgi:hypothetical protein
MSVLSSPVETTSWVFLATDFFLYLTVFPVPVILIVSVAPTSMTFFAPSTSIRFAASTVNLLLRPLTRILSHVPVSFKVASLDSTEAFGSIEQSWVDLVTMVYVTSVREPSLQPATNAHAINATEIPFISTLTIGSPDRYPDPPCWN